MKAIEEATSRLSAPITGATAAIAELPQIELPHATRTASLAGSPSARPMAKLAVMASATVAAIPSSSGPPSARTVAVLMDKPSSTTATSSSVLPLKSIPLFQNLPGVQAERTAVPVRIARTSASSQARPKMANSTRSSSMAASVTAMHSSTPGSLPQPCPVGMAVGAAADAVGGMAASCRGNTSRTTESIRIILRFVVLIGMLHRTM